VVYEIWVDERLARKAEEMERAGIIVQALL
jgi:hypothetical protein